MALLTPHSALRFPLGNGVEWSGVVPKFRSLRNEHSKESLSGESDAQGRRARRPENVRRVLILKNARAFSG